MQDQLESANEKRSNAALDVCKLEELERTLLAKDLERVSLTSEECFVICVDARMVGKQPVSKWGNSPDLTGTDVVLSDQENNDFETLTKGVDDGFRKVMEDSFASAFAKQAAVKSEQTQYVKEIKKRRLSTFLSINGGAIIILAP